jgi:hypothetical protein
MTVITIIIMMAGRIWRNILGDPQARPMAVTAISMSLMPMNGTMMPPMP